MKKLLILCGVLVAAWSFTAPMNDAQAVEGCVGAGCGQEILSKELKKQEDNPCLNPDPDKVWPWGLNPCDDVGADAIERKADELEAAEEKKKEESAEH